MFAPDWPIRTDRLVLRPFRDSDLDVLSAIHADEGVALLKVKIAGAAVRAPGEWLSAAVESSETGELVGDVDLLWASDQHHSGELGFIIHPGHQGKGYATEASRPLLDWAFGDLGLHRVIGRTEARPIDALVRDPPRVNGALAPEEDEQCISRRQQPGANLLHTRGTWIAYSSLGIPRSLRLLNRIEIFRERVYLSIEGARG